MTRSLSVLRLWIALFFLLSGGTALVYQVVWVRMVGMVVGASTLAVSIVVAAYMAGLGIGARLAGPAAKRSAHPLAVYGGLELGIGSFALLSPLVLSGMASLPVSGPLQLAVAGLALLPPTLAMGATLPMLTAWYARDEATLGKDMGWLYAINTTGAVLGAAASGFLLLPLLGQPTTLAAAGAVNLLVGAGALVLGRRVPHAPSEPAAAAPSASASAGGLDARTVTILAAFGLSGAAAMVNQVAWNRGFSLFTGSTTYAFSLIVCAFIAGLALGGHLLSRIVDRTQDRTGLLAGLNLAIALSSAVLVPIMGELPLWLLEPLAARSESFVATQTFVFGCLAGLLLLPTVMMGGTYPVATRALTRDAASAPAEVGRAYAWNTGGAILGSLGAGLVLIPALGLQDTLWVAVTLNLAAAAVLLRQRARVAWLLPAAGVLALLGSPDWDPRHMNLAPHIYATDLVEDPDKLAKFRDSGSVRFHEEGIGSTVTVVQRMSGSQVLRINGKTDASTQADKLHQGFIGALPMVLAPEIDDVLVIGLGSGMTLASALTFPVERLRVVELLPEVVRGARSFGERLGNPMTDERVEILVEDGRHLLMSEQADYDVIISQPTNLFISGMSTLFTQEIFEAMRDNLSDDGVALVWVQGYLVFEEDVKTIARTFQEVFPEAHLWNIGAHDLVFTGHRSAFEADPDALRVRMDRLSASPAVAWSGLREPLDLQRHYMMGPEALAAWAGAGPLHTDADPFLEFSAPKALFQEEGRLEPENWLGARGLLPTAPGAPIDGLEARRQSSIALENAALEGDLRALQRALASDPQHPVGLARQVRLQHEVALQLARQGDLDTAEALVIQLLERSPDVLPAWRLLASIAAQRGDASAATAVLARAAAANASNPYAHLFHARQLVQTGEMDAAREAFGRVMALDPDLPELALAP